jgi:flagellar biosynthetic protein FlhB
MADSGKTEEPTHKKIHDAEEKGQIIRSPEVNSVMQLAGFAMIMFFISKSVLTMMVKSFYGSFDAVAAYRPMTQDSVTKIMNTNLIDILTALAPIFAVLAVIALLTGGVQSGFKFAAKALTFDFKKLNPVQGFSKLFSARSWVELFKALFKITVIFIILYNIFQTEKEHIMLLSGQDMYSIAAYSGKLFFDVSKKIILFLLVVAVLDYIWQKYDYMQNLKMTKQEIKDEYKQTEGDPKTKAMIRRWHKKKLRTRMMAMVKQATFVSVNPTHYAVAVLYERGMKAPKLLAKGADDIAARIREEARTHKIPVITSPETTRAIYFSTEAGRFIPAKLYKAVAKILVGVYKMGRGRKNGR